MNGLVKCFFLACVALTASGHSLGPNDIVFHLFTRANPAESQPLFPTVGSISLSNFNTQRSTVITIHNNGGFTNFLAHMVSSHLEAADLNVIAVDWTLGSSMYSQGVANAPQVGRVIAEFVNILTNNFGNQVGNLRIVGHGLGGHVAGIAARHIAGVVPHIVALDPSLHGWTHHPERLSPNAAAVVEVIHATAGILGYDNPLGHLDFYPNGGSAQTGCGVDTSCSLTLAYAFYAESVLAEVRNGAKFVATRCDDLAQATTVSCTGERDVTFGGLESKQGVSGGIFSFITNPSTPFARN